MFHFMVSHERSSHTVRPKLRPATKPPCFYDEQMWDLDAVDFPTVKHAVKLCGTVCPQLSSCQETLAARIRAGDAPKNQVMAQRVFGSTGAHLARDTQIVEHMRRQTANHTRPNEATVPLIVVDPQIKPAPVDPQVEAAAVAAADARRAHTRKVLQALDLEVETKAGSQFALPLGA